MVKSILLIVSLIVEFIAFFILLDNQVTGFGWLTIFATHAIACFIFMVASWYFLPKGYQNSWLRTFTFLFLFTFLLPVFGMLGIMFSLFVALYFPIKQEEVTWQECEELPLPPSPGEINTNIFGAGALAEILTRNQNPERRLLAVSAIHYFPRNQAIPLLKVALKDLSDDVRLLAYSSLETIEAEINSAIGLCKKQLDKNKTASKAAEIGHQYWELCYLGIAEGSLLNHYLREAKNYLNISNKIESSGSNDLLLGRILLKQNDHENAEQYFEQALDAGILNYQVTPYLAECAFQNGDYKKVKTLVASFPDHKGSKLSQIKEHWS